MHVANLLDPLRCRVVWRMHRAWNVVNEEWLVWVDRGDAIHVFDRIVGHRCDKVPIRFTDVRVDRRRIAEKIWLPLISVTTDEAIEIVKAHTCRPLVEGPGLARLEFRRVVVLAEPGRPVAVILEDLSDRCLVPGHDAVVARIACRLLGHDPEAHRMMVTPR